MAKRIPKNPITPEHKAYFMSRVKYHQQRLNLNNWRIEEHPEPTAPDCFAAVFISPEDQLASVALPPHWSKTEITKEKLDGAALHECLHIFLTGWKKAVQDEEEGRILSEEHSVLTILETLLETPKELL